MNKLVEWLNGRGMSVRQLGKILEMSHSHVAKVLRGEALVTWEFAAAAAKGFDLDPLEAFYMAGLLKKGADLSEDAQAGPKVTMDSVAQVDSVVINGGGE